MKPPSSDNEASGLRFEEPSPPLIPDHDLIRCIGRGSYGEVWLARNVMGTYRAVKVVYRQTFQDDRPFEREFAGLQRFEPVSRSHESQVDILHIGRSDGWFHYVMELADDEIAGPEINPANYRPKTLRAAHEGQIQHTADETLEIGLALTTALEHLHKHGLVHRDIKPSNVIFVNGLPKLADIGLVSSVDATRSFVGTEGFVPPEGPGAATGDLYSLGKVLYELCTGRDRKDYPELPTSLAESPDRERLLELNAIINKACRENPKDRYQSATAMRQDLLLMQSGKSVLRMQKLERRLRFVQRAGAAVTALAFLILAAWFYQARQTRIVKQLADENHRLAEESQRHAEESRRNADDSNDSVVRLLLANGNQLADQSRYSEALPWFVEAFKRVQGDPERERIHRIRLNSFFSQGPHIVQVFAHDGGAKWCEFSPDGRRIATAGSDHTARVWDVSTGKPVAPPLRHEDEVLSVSYSPDGKWVVTASNDGTARVWDSETGNPTCPPLEHGVPGVGAEFSPNGEFVLTVIYKGPARIWEARTGKLLCQLPSEKAEVTSAWFSPDGDLLLTAEVTGRVTVSRWKDRTTVFPPLEFGQPAIVQDISRDGKSFVVSFGATARVLTIANGEPLARDLVHTSTVLRASFSPDGNRILTAEEKSGLARLWDANTSEPIGSAMNNWSLIFSYVFSPDGVRVATCSQFGEAKIWDASSGQPVCQQLQHGGSVLHAVFSPDGQALATASQDGLVRLWDLDTAPEPEITLRGPGGTKMTDAHFSPDGRTVLAALGESARMWDATSGNTLLSNLRNPKSSVDRVEFSADGTKFLLTSKWQLLPLEGVWQIVPEHETGPILSVWDAASGAKLCEITHQADIFHAAFSPDGRQVLTASRDATARVWDSATGQPLSPVLQHPYYVTYGEFSPDGSSIVTVSRSTNLFWARVWDTTTGRPLTSLFPHDAPIVQASFSPDGRRVVTATLNEKVRIWDAQTGKPITPPIQHGGIVYGVAFEPSGRHFASWSSANNVKVWETETGIRILPPIEHPQGIHDVEFSPDGRLLASSGEDGMVRLWDAATGELISVPLQHPAAVQRVRFHPSKPLLLTACSDGAARIWRIDPVDWPLEEVVAFSELHSAAAIDQTLSPSRLTQDQLMAAFELLRRSHSH